MTFDLDRFKAGEVAADNYDSVKYTYLATLENGDIAFQWKTKEGGIGASYRSLEWLQEYTTMQPKEEWVVAPRKWIYNSFDEAEKERGNLTNPQYFITVKITRQ